MHSCGCVCDRSVVCGLLSGRVEGCMMLDVFTSVCHVQGVCVCVCVCYVQDAVCAHSSWMPAVCASARHLIFAGRVHSVHSFQLHTRASKHTLFAVMSLIPSSMATVSEEAGGEREGKRRDPSFIVRG